MVFERSVLKYGQVRTSTDKYRKTGRKKILPVFYLGMIGFRFISVHLRTPPYTSVPIRTHP